MSSRMRELIEHRTVWAGKADAGKEVSGRGWERAPYNSAAMDHLWTPWRYAYVTGADKARPKLGVPEALAAWPGETRCVFCNMIAAVDYAIANGMPREEAEASVYLLERSRNCFLVLNAFPYNGGHLMVVPYRHMQSLATLTLEEADELMRLARRAERVLQAVYQPDGLNFGLNLGKAAGAGVAEHLHLHAVPRWSGDTNFHERVGGDAGSAGDARGKLAAFARRAGGGFDRGVTVFSAG